jgi:hypothetical protein
MLMFLTPVGAHRDLSSWSDRILSRSLLDWDSAESIIMARFAYGRKIETAPRSWNTIEQLRDIAMSRGCTPAQFKYAIEVMGNDPHHVANYLQRHEFVATLPAKKLQVA